MKKPLPLAYWNSFPQPVRYFAVGIFNTAAGYGLFGLLLLTLNDVLPYAITLLLSHFAAVTLSFLTHRFLVFQGIDGQLLAEYLRFQASYLWLLPQSLLINMGLVHYLALSPWAAQAITLGFGISTAYFIHRTLVFKHRI